MTTDLAPQNWIAVAAAEHVGVGRAGGFMQVCHGKAAPLRRVAPGDRIAYYAPSTNVRGGEKRQAFVALGIVCDRPPYQPVADGEFRPFRRDVAWFDTRDAPIAQLLDILDFSKGRRNWGYQLRFGLLRIAQADMRHIGRAMGVRAFAD